MARLDVNDQRVTADAYLLGRSREVDDDHVLAASANVGVLAGSAVQHIVTGSADQPIIPRPPAQDVVPFPAADAVRRGGTAEMVGVGRAVDFVPRCGLPGGEQ